MNSNEITAHAQAVTSVNFSPMVGSVIAPSGSPLLPAIAITTEPLMNTPPQMANAGFLRTMPATTPAMPAAMPHTTAPQKRIFCRTCVIMISFVVIEFLFWGDCLFAHDLLPAVFHGCGNVFAASDQSELRPTADMPILLLGVDSAHSPTSAGGGYCG